MYDWLTLSQLLEDELNLCCGLLRRLYTKVGLLCMRRWTMRPSMTSARETLTSRGPLIPTLTGKQFEPAIKTMFSSISLPQAYQPKCIIPTMLNQSWTYFQFNFPSSGLSVKLCRPSRLHWGLTEPSTSISMSSRPTWSPTPGLANSYSTIGIFLHIFFGHCFF